jgi:hypothetical protein
MKDSMSWIWERQFPIPIMMREDEDTGSNVVMFSKSWPDEKGEPTASYRWTGWVWEMSFLMFKTSRKITDCFRGINRIYLELIKAKPEDHTQHVTSWTWKHEDFDKAILEILPGHCWFHRQGDKEKTTSRIHTISVCIIGWLRDTNCVQ